MIWETYHFISHSVNCGPSLQMWFIADRTDYEVVVMLWAGHQASYYNHCAVRTKVFFKFSDMVREYVVGIDPLGDFCFLFVATRFCSYFLLTVFCFSLFCMLCHYYSAVTFDLYEQLRYFRILRNIFKCIMAWMKIT